MRPGSLGVLLHKNSPVSFRVGEVKTSTLVSFVSLECGSENSQPDIVPEEINRQHVSEYN